MELIQTFPEFNFQPDDYFTWAPATRTITYDPKRIKTNNGRAQLLHELGHALLNHQKVTDDTRYGLERDAWDVARVLAQKLGIRRQELYITAQLKELESLGY
jgi:hypothetical protein